MMNESQLRLAKKTLLDSHSPSVAVAVVEEEAVRAGRDRCVWMSDAHTKTHNTMSIFQEKTYSQPYCASQQFPK